MLSSKFTRHVPKPDARLSLTTLLSRAFFARSIRVDLMEQYHSFESAGCSGSVLARICSAFMLVSGLMLSATQVGDVSQATNDGLVRAKSAYSMDETIARLKKDIA